MTYVQENITRLVYVHISCCNIKLMTVSNYVGVGSLSLVSIKSNISNDIASTVNCLGYYGILI